MTDRRDFGVGLGREVAEANWLLAATIFRQS